MESSSTCPGALVFFFAFVLRPPFGYAFFERFLESYLEEFMLPMNLPIKFLFYFRFLLEGALVAEGRSLPAVLRFFLFLDLGGVRPFPDV